jgi:hypothetical protein
MCNKRLSTNEDLANKKLIYCANVIVQLMKILYGDHGITMNFINYIVTI